MLSEHNQDICDAIERIIDKMQAHGADDAKILARLSRYRDAWSKAWTGGQVVSRIDDFIAAVQASPTAR